MRQRRALIGALGLVLLAALIVLAGAALGFGSAASGARTVAGGQSIFWTAMDTRTGLAVVNRSNNSGRVQLLDTRTGALGRPITLGKTPWLIFVNSMVADEATGHVFILTRHFASTPATRDNVRMLDERSGLILHATPISFQGGFPDRLTLDAPAHRVLLLSSLPFGPSSGIMVSIFDTVSGRLLRTVRVYPRPGAATGCPCFSQPLVVDRDSGAAFVIDSGHGLLSRLDAISGRVLWTADLAPTTSGPRGALTLGAVDMDARTKRVFVVDSRAGVVWTLDATTGRLLGTTPVGAGPTILTIARRGGRVFIFNGGAVSVLDATSGRILRTIPTTLTSTFAALFADEPAGRVFLADERTGAVSMLDATSGRILRTVVVAPNIADGGIAVDRNSGRIVVVSGGALDHSGNFTGVGSASVLNGHGGSIVKTVSVGVNPDQVFIDETMGRAVVVNAGGPATLSDTWGWMPSWLRRLAPFVPPPPPHRVFSSVSVFDVRQ